MPKRRSPEEGSGSKKKVTVVELHPADFAKLHAAWESYVRVRTEIEQKYGLPEVEPTEPPISFVPA